VEAQARLKVRLDRVAEIVERVMDTVDRNPRILENLTDRLGETLAEVGSGAGRRAVQRPVATARVSHRRVMSANAWA
jgi:hypothetical protein